MILAAGLGTRLLPLTSVLPKALVTVHGKTLLELAIRKVAGAGFNDIIVNVHHHAVQVIDFLRQTTFPGISISISDESGQLLETGGAILKARDFLDGNEPFLVHNVDVVSNLDIREMLRQHSVHNSLATLSVSNRKTKRYFLFGKEMRLKGWTDISTGEVRRAGVPDPEETKLAFNGIHIINPAIFNKIRETGRFSIVNTYLDLAKENEIRGYVQPGLTWFDVGKPDQLEELSKFTSNHPEFIPWQ